MFSCLLPRSLIACSVTRTLIPCGVSLPLKIGRSVSTNAGGSDNNNEDDNGDLVTWTINAADRIGTLTLNSPATYNAMTIEMVEKFASVCTKITRDLGVGGVDDVDVIVLEGKGTDAFSAGGNLKWLHSLRDNSVHANADLMLHFYRSLLSIRQVPVPVIGALQGPAMGAGACLALACDLRTAAPKPKILGFHFTKLGIHSGMGGSHLLHSALGGGPSGVINEILLTGRILSGQEAFDLGLVNRLADDSKEAAYDMAKTIASKQHPVAVRTMLQTLRQKHDEGLDQCLHREAWAQAICYSRNDWGEGVKATAEKRDPEFDRYHSK